MHIDLTKHVLIRAAKLVHTLRHLKYSEILTKLTLPYRRTKDHMIEVDKMISKVYDTRVCNILTLCTGTRTGG